MWDGGDTRFASRFRDSEENRECIGVLVRLGKQNRLDALDKLIKVVGCFRVMDPCLDIGVRYSQ